VVEETVEDSTGSVLAVAPGEEERVRVGLVQAWRELKTSPESASVRDTYRALEEAASQLRQVVEDVRLLGWIPGRCNICKRLGM